ncbi:MAG: cupin-like domain-containing protein [Sphingomonadaceae bacterium]|nr:cupin-like domain-containing protein [Sphingomonadaceae bacterium]
MLTLEALAKLAETLPAKDLECNTSDLPIGVDAVPEQLLDGIGDRIRNIGETGCWAGLRHVEQDPAYKQLLWDLIEDVKPHIEKKTGEIMDVEGFIFMTSPGGVTPYHFDPEHNILLQIRGNKVMTLFPAGDSVFAADEMHETYHTGGRPELPWSEDMAAGGADWSINEGEALYVPVMAPHFVRNSDEISISISVTWRSEWSHAEADARALNKLLRKAGMNPESPRRWPQQNRSKSYTYRALRKIRAVG